MSVRCVKDAVRQRDGNRCTDCGLSNHEHIAKYGRQLHVHRIVPASVYSLEGCITLCYRCHGTKPKSTGGAGGQYTVRMREAMYQELEEDARRCYRTVNMHILWLIETRLAEVRDKDKAGNS